MKQQILDFLEGKTLHSRLYLEGLDEYQLYCELEAAIQVLFKGRFLAPMFNESKKFKVALVKLRHGSYWNVFGSQNEKGSPMLTIEELTLDLTTEQIITLANEGTVQTDIANQHVIGFCK